MLRHRDSTPSKSFPLHVLPGKLFIYARTVGQQRTDKHTNTVWSSEGWYFLLFFLSPSIQLDGFVLGVRLKHGNDVILLFFLLPIPCV